MNAQQYAQYEKNVADFLKKNHVKPGCHGPKFQEPEAGFEAFFSWRPCECCGSGLGGDRETYTFVHSPPVVTHPVIPQTRTFDADICTDCAYYLTYGRLDDYDDDGDRKLMSYTLQYREPGKRPNTERWARRKVESTREAIAWMNANKDKAFLPAFVLTNSWRNPSTVAILGPTP